MSAPPQQATLTPADKARLGLVQALRGDNKGAGPRPLAETVQANLDHVWEHGGRKGDMTAGLRPDWITVRQEFLVLAPDDPYGPVLPKLIQSRGLQLKLALLLLFDAQCRYKPGRSVRNVRRITPHPDEDYLPWRQLVLTAASSHRRPSNLRARQITEALQKLEEYDLLRIPRQPGGRRRIYSFGPDGKTTWQLQTEESNPDEHSDYLVPNPTPGTFRIPREFFTNLWIFALTDTEIAAYLTLTFLRRRFPAQHYARGSTSWTRTAKTISASRGPPGAPLISCTGFGSLTAHLHRARLPHRQGQQLQPAMGSPRSHAIAVQDQYRSPAPAGA
jgi:hypothetical protein